MEIFELSISGWDGDTFYALLSHENKTQEDFQNDVYRLLKEKGEDYIKSAELTGWWVEDSGWCEYILPFLYDLGYKEVEVKAVRFSDTGIINGIEEQWKKVVGEELFNLAVKENKRLEEML